MFKEYITRMLVSRLLDTTHTTLVLSHIALVKKLPTEKKQHHQWTKGKVVISIVNDTKFEPDKNTNILPKSIGLLIIEVTFGFGFE